MGVEGRVNVDVSAGVMVVPIEKTGATFTELMILLQPALMIMKNNQVRMAMRLNFNLRGFINTGDLRYDINYRESPLSWQAVLVIPITFDRFGNI